MTSGSALGLPNGHGRFESAHLRHLHVHQNQIERFLCRPFNREMAVAHNRHGVALLLDTIDKVRERLNFDLELEGILATMYDSRTTHCRQVLQRVVEAFGDKVYQTVITKTVKFPESTVAGAPILTLDPASSGARNYRQLAREVIAAKAERG